MLFGFDDEHDVWSPDMVCSQAGTNEAPRGDACAEGGHYSVADPHLGAVSDCGVEAVEDVPQVVEGVVDFVGRVDDGAGVEDPVGEPGAARCAIGRSRRSGCRRE